MHVQAMQSLCNYKVFGILSILSWRYFNTMKVMHHFKSVMANFRVLIHQLFPTVWFLNIHYYIYCIYKHMFSLKAYITWLQSYLHKAYSSNVDSFLLKNYFYFPLNLSTIFLHHFLNSVLKLP